MTDLRTLLDQSATAPAPVTRSVVEADVPRGRRALRQRLPLRGTRAQAPAPRPSASQPVGATALVAHTGALTLVSVGQADPARCADLAAKGVRDLQGRIAALQEDLPQGTSGSTVRVAGTTGLVAAMDLHGDADRLGGRTPSIDRASLTGPPCAATHLRSRADLLHLFVGTLV